jgi:Flp pilus assembly protein TadG
MKENKRLAFFSAEDGAAMLEFALVGAIFSVMLLGIIEFGLAAWQKNSVAADAREGARYAIVRGATSVRVATPESVSKYVKARTSLDTAAMSVYTTWNPDKSPNSEVTVRVAHTVPRRGPFIRAHRDSATSKMHVYK